MGLEEEKVQTMFGVIPTDSFKGAVLGLALVIGGATATGLAWAVGSSTASSIINGISTAMPFSFNVSENTGSGPEGV
jgi:hypothetical protein